MILKCFFIIYYNLKLKINFQSYTCQISAYKPTEIVHQISVRTQPQIEISSEDVITIREGETLDLTCDLIAGQFKIQNF